MPKPMKVVEKSKDFKGSSIRLFKSLNKWKYFLLVSIVLAMLSSILALIAPNKLSDLTDTITLGLVPKINEKVITDIMNDKSISDIDKASFMNTLNTFKDKNDINQALEKLDSLPNSLYKKIKPEINMQRIKKISLILLIIYLLSSLFSYIESLIMTVMTNKYAKSLRKRISIKINKLPLKYFDTHENGDILSRVTNDVDTVSQSMNQSITTLVTSITLFLGSIVMMFITNWIMSITAILSSIIGFMIMGILLKKSQIYFSGRQKELGTLNGYIEEMYRAHTVLKAYNAEEMAEKEFDELNKKLFTYNRKSQFLSGIMQPIMMFVGNFGYVAVCVVGAMLVIKGYITFGVIVAFMIYIRMFTNPLSQIAQAVTNLQSTVAASERVFEFLNSNEMTEETHIKTKLDKNKVKGNIEFKNVKFGYEKNKPIIKDFSLSAKSGSKIAIVGPTGAGKTTIVNLLMKFYEIDSGDILIDGISIHNLTRENIHDLFVMVLQDTWLFDGTINENLRFNKNNVKNEDIINACKYVGIDHFINTLPGGYNSNVNNNDSISSGQKQLLTIARGMIENAPFLILDEATSNVDTRTEELVSSSMDKLSKGKTSFIIAHRLSTIKNADIIIVMNEGNIIEIGNHKELMKLNGFYTELYNSQFKKSI